MEIDENKVIPLIFLLYTGIWLFSLFFMLALLGAFENTNRTHLIILGFGMQYILSFILYKLMIPYK